jgi:DNA helicase-2/ATP-dependent DNA helicase PcrA
LSVGAKVKHERFGTGFVENIEGVGVNKKAEILFESGGLKKLLLKFAKLDIIE